MTAAIESAGTPIAGKPTSNGGPTTDRSTSSVGATRPTSARASFSDPVIAGSESVIVPSRSTSTWVRRVMGHGTVAGTQALGASVLRRSDRLPHPLGGRRHVDVADPEV